MHDEGDASEIVQQSRPCDPASSPLVRPRIRASRLIIAAAIAGIVLAVWLHASQIARQASWKVTCSNQLKQIGFALWSYHAINRAFPCAVRLFSGGQTDVQLAGRNPAVLARQPDI